MCFVNAFKCRIHIVTWDKDNSKWFQLNLVDTHVYHIKLTAVSNA